MRMLRPGIHLELPEELLPQPVVRQHPADRVLERAVKGMLPHNRLGRELFTHLKVYAGPEHPHGAQVAGFPPQTSAATNEVKA